MQTPVLTARLQGIVNKLLFIDSLGYGVKLQLSIGEQEENKTHETHLYMLPYYVPAGGGGIYISPWTRSVASQKVAQQLTEFVAGVRAQGVIRHLSPRHSVHVLSKLHWHRQAAWQLEQLCRSW